MPELIPAAKELVSRIRESGALSEPTVHLLNQVLQRREDENVIHALALSQSDAILSTLYWIIVNQDRDMMANKKKWGSQRTTRTDGEKKKSQKEIDGSGAVGEERETLHVVAEDEEEENIHGKEEGEDGSSYKHASGGVKENGNPSEAHFLSFALCFLADLVFLSPVFAQSLGASSFLFLSSSTCGASSSSTLTPLSPSSIPSTPLPAAQFLDIAFHHRGMDSILHPSLYLAAVGLRHTPLDSTTSFPSTSSSSQRKDAVEGCVLSFLTIVKESFSQKVLQVENQEFIIRACVQLARSKALRVYLLHDGIIHYLPRLLTEMVSSSTSSILQLIYDSLLLAWLLSYEYEGVVQLYQCRMIPHLLRVLHRIQKEKCLRVSLMILSNMVEAEKRYLHNASHPVSTDKTWVDEKLYVLSQIRQVTPHRNHSGSTGKREDETGGSLTGSSSGRKGEGGAVTTAFTLAGVNTRGGGANTGVSQYARQGSVLVAEMVGVGMLKTLLALKRRKFGDEDIPLLLLSLTSTLDESMELITSFSEYRGEVLSGALDWTPVHTSSKFWQEHHLLMEASNYEVLQALGRIILESKDERTLAVACHDLGELVRYHPTGRSLLSLPVMSGVKERVIRLMFDHNQEVSKEALLCTQKIMVQQWEYV